MKKKKVKEFIKNIIYLRFVNNLFNLIIFKRAKINLPNKIVVNGRLYILNKGNIDFGNNIKINSGKNYNVIGGDTRTNIVVAKNASLIIGDNVGISNSTFVCNKNIIIEDNVLIGGNCKFYDTDFHSIDFFNRINPYKYNLPDLNVRNSKILVKNGAWIGGHCIILKGVTIGKQSIVGAGSVVSKNIPDYEIWAGNPIKFVKKLKE